LYYTKSSITATLFIHTTYSTAGTNFPAPDNHDGALPVEYKVLPTISSINTAHPIAATDETSQDAVIKSLRSPFSNTSILL
jgi:hypothetical protein